MKLDALIWWLGAIVAIPCMFLWDAIQSRRGKGIVDEIKKQLSTESEGRGW